MKRTISLSLMLSFVLSLLLSVPAMADNTAGFDDVSADAYYAEAIQWALANGITNGIGNNKFGVGQTVTRAQAVTFLWRSCGQKDPTTKVNPFKDVKESDYYYKAVLWAVENGITNGTSATTFSPNDNVTRGQLITFLYRTRGGSTDSGAQWYTAAENWAKSKNLLTGTAKTYATNAECPREDVVFYIWKEMTGTTSTNNNNNGDANGNGIPDYLEGDTSDAEVRDGEGGSTSETEEETNWG